MSKDQPQARPETPPPPPAEGTNARQPSPAVLDRVRSRVGSVVNHASETLAHPREAIQHAGEKVKQTVSETGKAVAHAAAHPIESGKLVVEAAAGVPIGTSDIALKNLGDSGKAVAGHAGHVVEAGKRVVEAVPEEAAKKAGAIILTTTMVAGAHGIGVSQGESAQNTVNNATEIAHVTAPTQESPMAKFGDAVKMAEDAADSLKKQIEKGPLAD